VRQLRREVVLWLVGQRTRLLSQQQQQQGGQAGDESSARPIQGLHNLSTKCTVRAAVTHNRLLACCQSCLPTDACHQHSLDACDKRSPACLPAYLPASMFYEHCHRTSHECSTSTPTALLRRLHRQCHGDISARSHTQPDAQHTTTDTTSLCACCMYKSTIRPGCCCWCCCCNRASAAYTVVELFMTQPCSLTLYAVSSCGLKLAIAHCSLFVSVTHKSI
jgi:hypothetical protein